MARPTWIGYTLSGRYRIDALLGQGGMSAVYRGHDPNLRRTVAIKLIHSHLASDPQFIQRFEQEASAVATLRHPNIVQVFDFNHDGDLYYMILEYLLGETLHIRLTALSGAGQRMAPAEAVRIGATIADALDYAHQRGLVHRDVKPANIMLAANGQPTLMDFGVVKIMGQQHTATGAMIGTPQYMAPEIVRGQRPDARSDLYSLGVVLFEMLAGRPPFEGASAMALMQQHVSQPVPDLQALNPMVPVVLARLVDQALAKQPGERFQSAAQLADALRAADRGLPTPPHLGMGNATVVEPIGTVIERPPAVPPPGIIPPGTPPPASRPSTNAPPPAGYTAPPAAAPALNRRPLYLGCGLAAIVGLLAIAVLATVSLAALNQNRATATPSATVTAPAAPTTQMALVGATATENEAPTGPGATATATLAPSDTPAPTDMPTVTATETSTVTPSVTPTQGEGARITGIQIVNGRYSVAFETVGYVAMLPGKHVHFFFDTVTAANAGSPGSGPWILHAAEPNPFTSYAVTDRPAGASQMCILVANPDHSVIQNTGNCWALP